MYTCTYVELLSTHCVVKRKRREWEDGDSELFSWRLILALVAVDQRSHMETYHRFDEVNHAGQISDTCNQCGI